jgi:hypothetical protein
MYDHGPLQKTVTDLGGQLHQKIGKLRPRVRLGHVPGYTLVSPGCPHSKKVTVILKSECWFEACQSLLPQPKSSH